MQLAEVGKLLAIVRSFDNRKLDESTAVAWKMMLDREVPEARLEDAQEVVLGWFANDNPYFEVRHLIAGLRKKMRLSKFNIETDVRSAKARGLISKDWPDGRALPWEVREKLAHARAADRAAAPAEIEGGTGAFELDAGRRL